MRLNYYKYFIEQYNEINLSIYYDSPRTRDFKFINYLIPSPKDLAPYEPI